MHVVVRFDCSGGGYEGAKGVEGEARGPGRSHISAVFSVVFTAVIYGNQIVESIVASASLGPLLPSPLPHSPNTHSLPLTCSVQVTHEGKKIDIGTVWRNRREERIRGSQHQHERDLRKVPAWMLGALVFRGLVSACTLRPVLPVASPPPFPAPPLLCSLLTPHPALKDPEPKQVTNHMKVIEKVSLKTIMQRYKDIEKKN